jgi:hypothetical protein
MVIDMVINTCFTKSVYPITIAAMKNSSFIKEIIVFEATHEYGDMTYCLIYGQRIKNFLMILVLIIVMIIMDMQLVLLMIQMMYN